jgi:hypothetical protein
MTARLFPNTSAAGKVTRASDGAAVPNTTVEPYVKIEGVWTLARLGILSDGEGNWSFPNIPPDTYRWKFTPPDGSKLVTSYFTDGSTVASDVALVPYGGGTSGINQALVGDTAPPTSWATVSPPAAGTGWSNAAVATVTIEATDGPTGVGVAAVGYRVNSQPTTSTYSGPVGISAEGTTTVAFAATDNFGNAEAAHGVTLRLDRTVPGLAHAIQPAIGLSTCSLEASDALSGVSAITYRVNGAAETTYTTALVLGVGSHQIVARAIDNAGNSRSETFAVDVAPLLPATVSLGTPSLSPSKPKHGKNAAFTSTISPADATKAAVTTLSLWRQETKKVKRKKVKYWHLRKKITMKLVAGKLKATYKLPYAGKWQTQSSFAGTDGFMAAASKMKSFTVK